MEAWDAVTSPRDGCQDLSDDPKTSLKRPFGANMDGRHRRPARYRTSGSAPPSRPAVCLAMRSPGVQASTPRHWSAGCPRGGHRMLGTEGLSLMRWAWIRATSGRKGECSEPSVMPRDA